MIFNSQIFIAFFICVYIIFILLKNHINLRNLLLLIASYIFYGWWNWTFLSLIMLSTIVDYTAGRFLEKFSILNHRRLVLGISVIFNLSLLAIFKYFNFFVSSFVDVFNTLGIEIGATTIHLILPVGISFYTFQTMSYTIDIYRGKLAPTHNLITFATFVAFFPQLVAGPIERASNLLPQLSGKLHITPAKVHSALFLILWGYFKKVAIADNVAKYANVVFADYELFTGVQIFVAILAFTVQLYCDFSGYSDIARGIARLMGIELMVNFRLPYFALSPSDFWNRWHISLSTWLKDYLYISLGGNRRGNFKTYRNLFITMLLGGLWHGAAWNFVLWGCYHGSILILFRRFDKPVVYKEPSASRYLNIYTIWRWIIMLLIIMYGWLLFRSESFYQIYVMTLQLFTLTSEGTQQGGVWLLEILVYMSPLILMQVAQLRSKDLLIFTKLKINTQIILAIILLVWLIIYGEHGSQEFIYFQF